MADDDGLIAENDGEFDHPLKVYPKMVVDDRKRGRVKQSIVFADFKLDVEQVLESLSESSSGYSRLPAFSIEHDWNALFALFKAFRAGGTLGMKGEHDLPREGDSRGIEAYARGGGDCNSLSYLFIMALRHAKLENVVATSVAGVVSDDQGVMPGSELFLGHGCSAVVVKGPVPEWFKKFLYKPFEEDAEFRRETLAKLGVEDNADYYLVLTDATYYPHSEAGFGFQPKRVDVLSDRQTLAMHRYSDTRELVWPEITLSQNVSTLERALETTASDTTDKYNYRMHVTLGEDYGELAGIYKWRYEENKQETSLDAYKRYYAKAEEHFAKAIELGYAQTGISEQDLMNSHVSYAMFLSNIGEQTKAITIFEQWKHKSSDTALGLAIAYNARRAKGDKQKAIDATQLCLKLARAELAKKEKELERVKDAPGLSAQVVSKQIETMTKRIESATKLLAELGVTDRKKKPAAVPG